jgi:hypothetical protein
MPAFFVKNLRKQPALYQSIIQNAGFLVNSVDPARIRGHSFTVFIILSMATEWVR